MALFFHAHSSNFIPNTPKNLGNVVDEIFIVPAYECEPTEDQDDDDDEGFYMEEIGENTIHCHINYESGAWAFYEAFYRYIAVYCPVDTGRLLSSCGCSVIGNNGDYEIFCWANTPYAEYVEYGTSRMRGQHYFEMAIQDAIEEAMPIWITEKQREEKEQSYLQAMDQAFDACEGIVGMSIFQIIVMFIIMIIITIIVEIITNFINDIISGNSYSLKNNPADFIYSA